MRSLVVGAAGLIGSHLTSAAAGRGFPCLGTWYRKPAAGRAPLDVRDDDAVSGLVADFEPDVVFLAAGGPDAEFAQAFPVEAREQTVNGAANVARAVRRFGGTLVVFSSDLVFGDCRTARREDHPADPACEHGEHLAAAEDVVRDTLPGRHLILRTATVYGHTPRPRGFAGRTLRALRRGEELTLAADRQTQPTYAPDLAAAAFDLLDRGYDGTFHVTGPDRTTEFAFARMIAFLHAFDADAVQPLARDADPDPRQRSPWLDRFKLRNVLGPKAVRPPGDGLRAMRTAAGVETAAPAFAA